MIENLLKYQEKDAELRKIETELSGSEERKNGDSRQKVPGRRGGKRR